MDGCPIILILKIKRNNLKNDEKLISDKENGQ